MLWVTVAPAVAANTAFTFTVPGHQVWDVISVQATLSRSIGGTPNRSLRLQITDGTNAVVTTPATDAGTEPGTLTVTWTQAQPSAVSSGSQGVSMGPLARCLLPPGYRIIGTVLNGVAADQWTRAVCWWNDGRAYL